IYMAKGFDARHTKIEEIEAKVHEK
ncbi:phosphate transport system regulator PhoU, partial [Acinetobacter nosocomialis]|nr:phosphate transport system regulator PhoU [Acinetobacter nosocomialis]